MSALPFSTCGINQLSAICTFLPPSDVLELSRVNDLWYQAASRWDAWSPKLARTQENKEMAGQEHSAPSAIMDEFTTADDAFQREIDAKYLDVCRWPIVASNVLSYFSILNVIELDKKSGNFDLLGAAVGSSPAITSPMTPMSPSQARSAKRKKSTLVPQTPYDDFDDAVFWDALGALFGLSPSDTAITNARAALYSIPTALWLLHTAVIPSRYCCIDFDDAADVPTDFISVILSTVLAVSSPVPEPSTGRLPLSVCLGLVDLFRFFALPASPIVLTFSTPLLHLIRSTSKGDVWSGDSQRLCAACVEAIGAVGEKLVSCGNGDTVDLQVTCRILTVPQALNKLRQLLDLLREWVADPTLLSSCCDIYFGPITKPLLLGDHTTRENSL